MFEVPVAIYLLLLVVLTALCLAGANVVITAVVVMLLPVFYYGVYDGPWIALPSMGSGATAALLEKQMPWAFVMMTPMALYVAFLRGWLKTSPSTHKLPWLLLLALYLMGLCVYLVLPVPASFMGGIIWSAASIFTLAIAPLVLLRRIQSNSQSTR